MTRLKEILDAALFLLLAITFSFVPMPEIWHTVIISSAIIYSLFIILKVKDRL